MVRKGVHRRSSKRGSQISALKRLSLLDPPTPEAPLIPFDCSASDESPVRSDHVYLHAAAIFQSTHLEKAVAHRIISFGKRSEVALPVARDEAEQRSAYQLAFNTLMYQELLEDVLIDSCFCLSQPMAHDRMSLVAVMLTDLLDRKFLPRLQPANQEQEEVKSVREVEACLLRFRTKLMASLARCRIKHDLLTLDNIVPEDIRHRQERATHLLLYAWINTHHSSLEEVTEVLHTSGFVCVKSVGQLEGRSFCKDPQCHDLLVFPNAVKRDLTHSRLLTDGRLVIQDKPCCVGPCALRPLLSDGGDVLMAGCFSAHTIAHVSAVAASAHTHAQTHTPHTRSQTVIVCLGDGPHSHTDELQKTLSKLGCNNVKLLSGSLESLDPSDSRLLSVAVMFLMPPCSLSAVSNPVEYIIQENRDARLLLDLSQGSVSPEKLQELTGRQREELQRAVHFPQVRAVLYSTCSVHSEENEEVLKTVLTHTQESDSTAPPYRLSSPGLLQDSVTGDEEESETKSSFFRLEASDQNNGCFLALLTRQPEPEVIETPQEVLARAAAKGLLDGLLPNQPIRKEGRGRRSRRAPANQRRSVKTRPHATQSDQSRVVEFLNREMRGSHSEPTVSHQNGRNPSHRDKSAGSRRPSQGVFLNTDSTQSSTLNSNQSPAHSPTLISSSLIKSLTRSTVAVVSANSGHSPSVVTPPPAPPKGRQEVLRPATVTFPPVLSPSNVLLPQQWSPAPPAWPRPSHTLLQWSNWAQTQARPRTRTTLRARASPLRPWI